MHISIPRTPYFGRPINEGKIEMGASFPANPPSRVQ